MLSIIEPINLFYRFLCYNFVKVIFMKLYDYIDEYGIYDFDEVEFNDIDSVIFSLLSYANLSEIVDNNYLTIKMVGRIHFGLYKGGNRNIAAVREANKLLRYIKDTKRYENCILSNYVYVGNKEVQFGALSIEYKNNHVYVAFEGTNELFSGWKENFILSYQFPTKSHNMAIEYLNKYFTYNLKNIIVGGHSKGGNLALVASMYSNFFVRSKIKKVYNLDGPGLLDKEFASKEYRKIQSKYVHIIPECCLVGLLLNNSNNYVVKTSIDSILAHDVFYWEIENNSFVKGTLNPLSKELDKELRKWFKKYNNEDKIDFINNLQIILDKTGIVSILDLIEKKKNIFNLIYESRDINEHTKKILLDLFTILMKCIGNVKREELKNFINKNILSIKR